MRHSLLLFAVCSLTPWSSSLAQPAEPCGLDGTWVEVVSQPSREEHPAYRAPRDPATLVIDGDSFLVRAGDRVLRRSLIRLVPGQTPEAADLMTVVGGEFWLTRAIFKVEGDRLTIKEGTRDRVRPTDFAPWEFDGQNSDSQASVHVYKRRDN
jgi:uncharacterized protein (TIGR03067 family)